MCSYYTHTHTNGDVSVANFGLIQWFPSWFAVPSLAYLVTALPTDHASTSVTNDRSISLVPRRTLLLWSILFVLLSTSVGVWKITVSLFLSTTFVCLSTPPRSPLSQLVISYPSQSGRVEREECPSQPHRLRYAFTGTDSSTVNGFDVICHRN